MTDRPRVGISRCLLGDEVRYDGGHKLAAALLDHLGPHVEWVPVCPEVEVGMGTPREPIQLVAGRLVAVHSGEDWTARMCAWAAARIDALKDPDLSGYVFKARSPSCGLERGVFAEALVAAMPDLPVADEEQLQHRAERERFLGKIRAYRRSRGQGPT